MATANEVTENTLMPRSEAPQVDRREELIHKYDLELKKIRNAISNHRITEYEYEHAMFEKRTECILAMYHNDLNISLRDEQKEVFALAEALYQVFPSMGMSLTQVGPRSSMRRWWKSIRAV